jgi:hypothetical protein
LLVCFLSIKHFLFIVYLSSFFPLLVFYGFPRPFGSFVCRRLLRLLPAPPIAVTPMPPDSILSILPSYPRAVLIFSVPSPLPAALFRPRRRLDSLLPCYVDHRNSPSSRPLFSFNLNFAYCRSFFFPFYFHFVVVAVVLPIEYG